MANPGLFQGRDGAAQKKKNSGPPNRMNDMAYSDWMKYQKSFFEHSSFPDLALKSIEFFTKARWPEGAASRSLIIGFDDFDPTVVAPPRQVQAFPAASLQHLCELLEGENSKGLYDWIFINLMALVTNADELEDYLSNYAPAINSHIQALLCPGRYCGFVVRMPDVGGSGFPISWAISTCARNALRLRDEKIGLMTGTDEAYCCVFLQNTEDSNVAIRGQFSPGSLTLVERHPNFPAWLIPRPPPRNKKEMLHPAKFPETLISEFLSVFTEAGDNVLDPMAGTGSTLIAAIQAGRNGYGVELSSEFAEITRQRLAMAKQPALFQDLESGHAVVVEGDAVQLASLAELRGSSFAYCITSPPYWSMLSNEGSENQKARREKQLKLVYSDDKRDLGNVQDYAEFLSLLQQVYEQVAEKLSDEGYLTVIVKNVKRNHIVYPLAWDLTAALCGPDGKFDYAGTTLWLQDDVALKPFAVGIHWVSNTLHQYCLHYQKRNRLIV